MKRAGLVVALGAGAAGSAGAKIPPPEFALGDAVSVTEMVHPYLEACPPASQDTENCLFSDTKFYVDANCWDSVGRSHYYELEDAGTGSIVGWVAESDLESYSI